MRTINFKPNDPPADVLHHSNRILKTTSYIKLLNFRFAKNVLARRCLGNFQGTTRLANSIHQHSTRHAANNSVKLR